MADIRLAAADLRVLLQVARANIHALQLGMPAGTPYLYSGGSHKRARALCGTGLLKLHDVGMSPPTPSLVPVTITDAGIAAYNAAISVEGAKT